MRRWFYTDYEPIQRSAADAALPVVVGMHLLQVLPKALAARTLRFPAFNVPNQVSNVFLHEEGASPGLLHDMYQSLCILFSPASSLRFCLTVVHPDLAMLQASKSGCQQI